MNAWVVGTIAIQRTSLDWSQLQDVPDLVPTWIEDSCRTCLTSSVLRKLWYTKACAYQEQEVMSLRGHHGNLQGQGFLASCFVGRLLFRQLHLATDGRDAAR